MRTSPTLIHSLLLVCAIALLGCGTAHAAPRLGGRDGGESERPTTPRLPVAVDVVLEHIDLTGKSEESVGENIVNDDKPQTIRVAMFPQQTQNFLVHIKNMSCSSIYSNQPFFTGSSLNSVDIFHVLNGFKLNAFLISKDMSFSSFKNIFEYMRLVDSLFSYQPSLSSDSLLPL